MEKTTLFMNTRQFILIILVFFTVNTIYAQDWLTKALGDAGAEQKAKLDSIDFQFAISVNESAGMFDVEQKGEGLAKGLYALKDRGDKTPKDIARDTLEFALSLYNLRMYKLAESSLLEAKSYMEDNSLTEDVLYLRCISSIALSSLAQSKITEANEYITWALETSLNTRGKNSVAYIANLNSMAKLNQQLGKYNEAEKDFDETLELTRNYFGESMQYAIVANNKAMLYQTMGRYDEAIDLMKSAIVASEKAPKKAFQGKKSFDNRRFQSNLAAMYHVAGKFKEAETSYLAIKKIFENRSQVNNPEYAGLLNQLGILYIQMNKIDKVEELLKKSQSVYKKKYTEQHPLFAGVTANLGNFYRMQGRNNEAESLLNKSLKIREETLGVNHPDYARSQEDLAILYWKTGRLDQAYTTYRDVMDKTIDFINHYFPPMSEAEKTKYWDVTAPRFQRFFNFAIHAHTQLTNVAQDFFDYQMATKALLLNSTNKVKQAILKSKDPVLIKDYLSWLDQKEQLARLYAYSKEELKEQKINLTEMERSVNAMEKSLSQRSTDFSSGYSTQKISYKQVLSMLNDQEALVDVVRVKKFNQDFTDDAIYVALVLKKGYDLPRMVVLDNGKQLESRYAKFYKNAIQQRIDDDYSYAQYWERIEKVVGDKKVVYLSPDGVYNQININTLRKSDGDFAIKQIDLVTIGNAKDLIEIKNRKASVAKKNAFLLGFPDYGTTEVSALPGTKTEIDGVVKILKASGYQVNQFMQKEASEKNVKSINSPYLVHIATHGYFLEDTDSKAGNVFGVNAENASSNPLLRSGLILAGAGKAMTGSQGVDLSSNDNGVLTAYEAMNLDLTGTDLVILSACETGLGDVKAGEGVYGLQRAFLVAGANALIMSLWKVDDAASQMLMTNFYTNWIKTGNKQKAFKQAQLQLMTKYKEPYYWGAFVMMGM
jgi:CHAT domain-containing protein